jgi:ABC-type Fe3+-hydroxamate transport system substrate-binding protein
MIFQDQLGRKIELCKTPQRIISLVPSQTELLFDLGLEEEVVGITKFCIHPKKWHQSKVKVGGTKNINYASVKKLQPDLIIANKEENTKEEIEQLSQEFPVWISDIYHLTDALTMIKNIGEIVGRKEKAENLVKEIYSSFSEIKPLTAKPKVLYLIWRKPWMSANAETFIHEMLVKCGFMNVAQFNNQRYPVLTKNEIYCLTPEIVFLSSEPYPFKEKHIKELQEILPNSKIWLVDGEAFSWYGSHLLKSADYFKELQNLLSP